MTNEGFLASQHRMFGYSKKMKIQANLAKGNVARFLSIHNLVYNFVMYFLNDMLPTCFHIYLSNFPKRCGKYIHHNTINYISIPSIPSKTSIRFGCSLNNNKFLALC